MCGVVGQFDWFCLRHFSGAVMGDRGCGFNRRVFFQTGFNLTRLFTIFWA
jgi:hypothetical protein